MKGFIYNKNKGVQYPLVQFEDDFYEFCSNKHIDTSLTLKECEDTEQGIIYNIPDTQFSICLHVIEENLKDLIVNNSTSFGINIDELKNIVDFYNEGWKEDVTAFILYYVLQYIPRLDIDYLNYSVDQFIGKIYNEDYYAFVIEQLNISIDPLLEAYIDYESYVKENFITIEHNDIIYVFDLE